MANMFLMTGTMLVIRIMGMVFNIYFTSVIGADSTGMYHLIFSVYGFMITFSVAGTGLAVTRLVSESGAGSVGARRAVVRKSLVVCVSMAMAAATTVWLFGGSISNALFGDSRGTRALSLLAVSLPGIVVSAVLRGYFIAVRRVATVTASQLIEEISCIIITLYLLSYLKNTPHGYMAMIAGVSFSGLVAAVFDTIMYRISISSSRGGTSLPSPGYRDIFAISVPVALGSYLRSGLVSAENILIPRQLALSGIADSLGEYGVIKGMSMPMLLFPTVFISSLATMLVPEVARRKAGNMPNGIRYIASRAIELTMYFSVLSAMVFVICHDLFAQKFYNNPKVGVYLGLLSLLVIPMYLDTVVDSMLKGLNEQVTSLKYNIIDSCIRVSFIWLVIPGYGVMAYIFLLYASELFNLWLSISRLIKVTGLKLEAGIILTPLLVGAVVCLASELAGFEGVWKAVAAIIMYIIWLTLKNFKKL